MWPEEEIGSSSVGPWSRPSTTAWPSASASVGAALRAPDRRRTRARSRSGSDIGGGLTRPPAPPPDDRCRDQEHHDSYDHVVDVAERVLPVRPVAADLAPDQAEREDPRAA